VCSTPLYRRPADLVRARHVACMAHRGEAQRLSGVTEAQRAGLALGREKGTNHRSGYQHREESRAFTASIQRRFSVIRRIEAFSLETPPFHR